MSYSGPRLVAHPKPVSIWLQLSLGLLGTAIMVAIGALIVIPVGRMHAEFDARNAHCAQLFDARDFGSDWTANCRVVGQGSR